MKNPIRITVALDEESYEIFNSLREKFRDSQSELIRKALRFYHDYQELENYDRNKVKTYVEMLAEGEHIILDIDHWIAFLKFIETHPESEKFWEIHREVARAHAEEFRGKDAEYILERLEACNFFRINAKNGEWTLVLNHEATKKFVKLFLECVLRSMDIDVEVKEDLMKLRLRIFERD
jgi:Arc/MetJ-type ribon-helix-helix transcriptional regulator